jgi:hypothetical protein
VQGVGEKWIFSSSSRSFGYGFEAERIMHMQLVRVKKKVSGEREKPAESDMEMLTYQDSAE